MANKESCQSLQTTHLPQYQPIDFEKINRYGWRLVNNTLHAVQFTFDSISIINRCSHNADEDNDNNKNASEVSWKIGKTTSSANDVNKRENLYHTEVDNLMMRPLGSTDDDDRQHHQDTSENFLCIHRCAETINFPRVESNLSEMQQKMEKNDASGSSNGITLNNNNTESISSMRSIGSFVCRICHNAENPERLVSPCLCKGTLSYVHTFCLEHWISTSGKTKCELCQFQYKTIQTLRYTCLQSLRMWYSHSMSRRALQEDCQMFSLLTLVAFGIIGTILVGIQHYFVQAKSSNMPTVARIWTRGWLLFFLFTTFSVYFLNIYILIRGQLSPWYRWWQSAREIKLILENRKTFHPMRRLEKSDSTAEVEVETAPAAGAAPAEMSTHLQDAQRNTPIAEQEQQEIAIGTVCLTTITYAIGNNGDAEMGGRRHALVPSSSGSDDTTTATIIGINNQQEQPQQQRQRQQEQNEQLEGQQQEDNHDHGAGASCIDI